MQPVGMASWSADSRFVTFGATPDLEAAQGMRLDTMTGKTRALTKVSGGIKGFAASSDGRFLVTFGEGTTTSPSNDPTCRREGCAVTSTNIFYAERGTIGRRSLTITRHEVDRGKAAPIAVTTRARDGADFCYPRLEGGLSPNGMFGILQCRIIDVPAKWRMYSVDEQLAQNIAIGDRVGVREYFLLDFRNRSHRSLLQAPVIGYGRSRVAPIWIDGGRSVLLVGVLSDLDKVDPKERRLRGASWFISSVDVETGEITRVSEVDADIFSIVTARWNDADNALFMGAVDRNGKDRHLAFDRTKAGWIRRQGDQAEPRQAVRFDFRQDLNTRPVVVAIDSTSGRETVVMDSNRWLENYDLGVTERVTWKSKDGYAWSGPLTYPPHFDNTKKYPLLLQTHGMGEEKFSLYGVSKAWSSQSTAAKGILVLEVREQDRTQATAATPSALPAVQLGYESAIDALDAKGMIDRRKVGITGWSRSGPWMGYALTHSSYEFAAGFFSDTTDEGWWAYIVGGNEEDFEATLGARPFGAGLGRWLESAPGFNLDRVRTPILMMEPYPSSMWDWWHDLKRLGKPVDYWILPTPTHDPVKLSYRLAMNEQFADWVDF